MSYTGFVVNSAGGAVCADTSQHALDALGALFPVVGGSPSTLCMLYSSSYSAPNIFPLNIICHDLESANQWQYTHNIYLPSCDPALKLGGNAYLTGLDFFTPDIPTAIGLTIAIWLVWTVGYGIRQLIRSLRSDDQDGLD